MSAPESHLDSIERRIALSALMDGDPDASSEEACRFWRGDASARADWHAWHLIGDVMRSDEHRADAGHDARFLARVRERLAHEPVVVAPAPLVGPAAVPSRARSRWKAPAAVAAGFVAVAGVLVATRSPAPDAASGVGLASTGASPVAAASVVATAASASVPPAAENAPMIRDAQLDRYLSAHRQFANGAVQFVPGGSVRQAAAAAPGR